MSCGRFGLCRFFQWVMSKADPNSKAADSAKVVYIGGLHAALALSSGHTHFVHFIPVSGACERRRAGRERGKGRGGEGRRERREGRGEEGGKGGDRRDTSLPMRVTFQVVNGSSLVSVV